MAGVWVFSTGAALSKTPTEPWAFSARLLTSETSTVTSGGVAGAELIFPLLCTLPSPLGLPFAKGGEISDRLTVLPSFPFALALSLLEGLPLPFPSLALLEGLPLPFPVTSGAGTVLPFPAFPVARGGGGVSLTLSLLAPLFLPPPLPLGPLSFPRGSLHGGAFGLRVVHLFSSRNWKNASLLNPDAVACARLIPSKSFSIPSKATTWSGVAAAYRSRSSWSNCSCHP